MSNRFNGLAKVAVFFSWLFLLLSGYSQAQVDWLKKGQELLAPTATSPVTTETDTSQVAGGIKEALRVGCDRVVSQLGTLDGFNADPAIHIPLPDSFKTVQSALKTAGMS
ncbi:MAG: DUF4197 family protein, partial [Deltaproteobacteria bacterium]|nr:DUF4197 family protein [Deltaproteobacteria bacterium]